MVVSLVPSRLPRPVPSFPAPQQLRQRKKNASTLLACARRLRPPRPPTPPAKAASTGQDPRTARAAALLPCARLHGDEKAAAVSRSPALVASSSMHEPSPLRRQSGLQPSRPRCLHPPRSFLNPLGCLLAGGLGRRQPTSGGDHPTSPQTGGAHLKGGCAPQRLWQPPKCDPGARSEGDDAQRELPVWVVFSCAKELFPV